LHTSCRFGTRIPDLWIETALRAGFGRPARNTAAAILLAVETLLADGGDPLLIVLPADHAVAQPARFREYLRQAVIGAEQGEIVTLGVQPDTPETGYGYIEAGEILNGNRHRVARFVEKPDEETARAYLASGRFFWNAGIFVFRASVMAAELARLQPEIARAVGAFLKGDHAAYAAAPNLSLDYAVMEHTQLASVLPADFGWSDLGSWSDVWAHDRRDEDGTGARGAGTLRDCRDSYFHAGSRLVAALGVTDLVVVETPEAVLEADRHRAQQVRQWAGRMQAMSATEHRPWGSFTILSEDRDQKTKRLDVLPGKRLSLQSHHHRNEFWVVIRGLARVTRDDEIFDLKKGETTLIPAGIKHRIENPGLDLLSLIEVQLGSYFGEDDIVRYEDDFGRLGAPAGNVKPPEP